MCEAMTLAGIGGLAGGLPGAQLGLGVGTQLDAADAEATSLRAQRDAELRAAGDARVRGDSASGIERMKGSQAVGEAKVEAAANGLETDSGSPLTLLEGTRAVNEFDARTIRSNSAREAWGHEVQATALEAAARNAKYQGKLKAASSFFDGLTGQGKTALAFLGKG